MRAKVTPDPNVQQIAGAYAADAVDFARLIPAAAPAAPTRPTSWWRRLWQR